MKMDRLRYQIEFSKSGFIIFFIAQDAIESKTYDAGQQLKGQFVTESGLDVEKS